MGTPRSGYIQPYADIAWRDEDTPFSLDYDDIYWSDGLAEKRHVFIEGNDLATRFGSVDGDFTVAEIGFGFGLNLLLTVSAWRARTEPGGACLHYVSFERRPVAPDPLTRLYERLVPREAVAAQLLRHYPLPTAGTHVIPLAGDVRLTLVIGDVSETLDGLEFIADAWHLDGFSPAVNQDVWNQDVYRKIAAHSRSGTTLATYAVAGRVRRGLSAAGFDVIRTGGYGKKTQMLRATMPPPAIRRHRNNRPARVVVIGAGLAGLSCARALLERRVGTTVIEAAARPLEGASKVSQMAVYPQLALQPGPWNHFSLAAFQYLCRREPAVSPCGFALLTESSAAQERFRRLAGFFPDEFLEFAGAETLSRVSGLAVDRPGALFRSAGWLDLSHTFTETLARADLRPGTRVADIRPVKGRWALLDESGIGILEAEQVIIATGAGTLPLLDPIPSSPVRGQSLVVALPPGSGPRCVIAREATVFPPIDGRSTVSATYQPGSTDLSASADDTASLMAHLRQLIPDTDAVVRDAVVGLRMVARDRMPVVGPLPDWSALDAWRQRDRHRGVPFRHYRRGLYVCGFFGSHGATHAALCAEHIAALVCGEPPPLTRDWQALLGPARFA